MKEKKRPTSIEDVPSDVLNLIVGYNPYSWVKVSRKFEELSKPHRLNVGFPLLEGIIRHEFYHPRKPGIFHSFLRYILFYTSNDEIILSKKPTIYPVENESSNRSRNDYFSFEIANFPDPEVKRALLCIQKTSGTLILYKIGQFYEKAIPFHFSEIKSLNKHFRKVKQPTLSCRAEAWSRKIAFNSNFPITRTYSKYSLLAVMGFILIPIGLLDKIFKQPWYICLAGIPLIFLATAVSFVVGAIGAIGTCTMGIVGLLELGAKGIISAGFGIFIGIAKVGEFIVDRFRKIHKTENVNKNTIKKTNEPKQPEPSSISPQNDEPEIVPAHTSPISQPFPKRTEFHVANLEDNSPRESGYTWRSRTFL